MYLTVSYRLCRLLEEFFLLLLFLALRSHPLIESEVEVMMECVRLDIRREWCYFSGSPGANLNWDVILLGDTSGSSKPPVDIKMNAAFQYEYAPNNKTQLCFLCQQDVRDCMMGQPVGKFLIIACTATYTSKGRHILALLSFKNSAISIQWEALSSHWDLGLCSLRSLFLIYRKQIK